MAGKARETYDESVTALHQWLQFLDNKEFELKAQMERLRSKGGEVEEKADTTDKPDSWL